MAKGYAREAIWLEQANGTRVDSPFLNLSTDLRDREQRRLTLLLDPGRIKQGVGPNESNGAPLKAGKAYTLVVSAGMRDVTGASLKNGMRLPLVVTAPERSAISPVTWEIDAPRVGTRDELNIHFDRLMDHGSSLRRLELVTAEGVRLSGTIESNGTMWRFTPLSIWRGTEQLKIDPRLEDVAGNTLRAPFDAPAGSMGQALDTITLKVFDL